MIMISDLPEFDITEHLDSDEAMAEYLTLVLAENDPALLAAALGDVAKARGMTAIAQMGISVHRDRPFRHRDRRIRERDRRFR